ncbi:MAG: carbonic anhydrase [Endozoicomonadaceae bacterium]|nr:carbonic anhydrase [Endozoicomonadaceae bacterium]
MKNLEEIFAGNQLWSEKLLQLDPSLLKKLNQQQQPEYLWIGCCDSRVPPELITNTAPGTMLVHRNIANQVLPDDLSLNAILQFGLHILKIRKIIVSGHTNCGGVHTAIKDNVDGNMASWLRSLKNIYSGNKAQLEQEKDDEKKVNLLCALNVKEQIHNLKQHDIVRTIETEGESVSVYGLIYDMKSGQLKKLDS